MHEVHEVLVKSYVGDKVVMHMSRDSTEVQAREKPVKTDKPKPKPRGKAGRPKKGEEPANPEPTRIEKQLEQTAEEALAELPYVCNVGGKKDALPMEPYRAERYKERSTAERGNSRLKDAFGLRNLRVRGHRKAHLHIMFGILPLIADQY